MYPQFEGLPSWGLIAADGPRFVHILGDQEDAWGNSGNSGLLASFRVRGDGRLGRREIGRLLLIGRELRWVYQKLKVSTFWAIIQAEDSSIFRHPDIGLDKDPEISSP